MTNEELLEQIKILLFSNTVKLDTEDVANLRQMIQQEVAQAIPETAHEAERRKSLLGGNIGTALTDLDIRISDTTRALDRLENRVRQLEVRGR